MCVHEGPVLSLIQYIVVEEATREGRKLVPWELLYVVLIAESEEKVLEAFGRWRKGMEARGQKVDFKEKSNGSWKGH